MIRDRSGVAERGEEEGWEGGASPLAAVVGK